MNLVSFNYVKPSDCRLRFVAVKSNDGLYIKGVDLSDGVFKTFLVNQCKDMYNHGDFEEYSLQTGNLLSRGGVYALLSYPSGSDVLLNDLKCETLVDLVKAKTGNTITYLRDKYFLLLGQPCVKLDLYVGNQLFILVFTAQGIEYQNSKGVKIKPEEVSRAVLKLK